MRTCGLVLAAGAGTRFGMPKGLARTASGEAWVARAVVMLRAGGCDEVLVAVGDRAAEVALLVPDDATVIHAEGWADGLSATLRAGLSAAAARAADVVVITPVDTPDASPLAVARVLAASTDSGALAQAMYAGEPGHPVVVGSDHFAALSAALTGDRGARAYLVTHGAREVECADLWSGADVDTRP